MKKSSSKSPTFVLALSMAMILLALLSCRSIPSTPIVQSSDSTSLIKKKDIQNSAFLIQNTHIHDSVIYRERTIHDTVYITKEVYRDALNSKSKIQNSAQSDTVRIVEYRDRVLQKPPERYVPKFYKWCTGVLLAIIVLAIGRLGYKVMRRL